jgi:CRP-like cAMP-binding protein
MVALLIRKLEVRDHLTDEEKQLLHDMVTQVEAMAPHQDLMREGDRPSQSGLILEGIVCRYKLLSEGRRQITAVHIAGDFVDLHSFILRVMDDSLLTITRSRIGFVPHAKLRRITETHPHLARILWLNTLVDAAIQRRWLTAMGRQSALSHTAHLLCELWSRLKVVGLVDDDSFELPMTQTELGDCIGLSHVHMNRTIQELRTEGLITWRGHRLVLLDWDRLVQLGEFSPDYLHLQSEPR